MTDDRSPPDGPGRILVADDEPAMRAVLTRLLARAGYQVTQANDGVEAWERIGADAPDLVVCDWMMPQMDGLEICHRLRARGPGTPFVILVSAKSDPEDFIAGLDAGADGYITKPVQSGEFLAQVRAGLRIRRLEQRLVKLNDELHHLATTDPLTQVANRRAFLERLRHEFDRQARSGQPFAVVMMDVDHLKQVNDSLGHQAGDDALRELAGTVRDLLRSIDMLARWGGDEFVALLIDADTQGALAYAERVRSRVEEARFCSGLITLSLGVAAAPANGPAPEPLLHAADEALYAAKRHGRNRVIATSALRPSPVS
jgi:two-component system cell cycle response regulator